MFNKNVQYNILFIYSAFNEGDPKVKLHKGEFTNSNLVIVFI